MRKAILFGLTAAVIAIAAPRSAQACGQGNNYAAFTWMVLAVGAADAAFSLYDLGTAGKAHRPSGGYGLLETLVTLPQFAVAVASFKGGHGSSALALYAGWTALLAGHGICTMLNASASPPPPEKAQVALSPTYVPLGQFADPGIGLTGRF